MSEKLYETLKITDLKDMLTKTKQQYKNRPAYKIKISEGKYKIYTHEEIREIVDALGTALIDIGLKGKRIAVIGENRLEWEIAYLSVVCGTGVVVPLDKSLPENELSSLIQRAEVEAIFYSEKYEETIKKIKYSTKNKLKHLISMDRKISTQGIYSQEELIQKGHTLIKNKDTSFINAKINPEEMSIMLFTSGTTSNSKVVALSHKNICSNLMDIGSILDVNEEDTILSVLPDHHVFECTVGFLFSLYKGSQIAFCDGIRHIIENLNEYEVTVMACVPGIYERLFMAIRRSLEKKGKLQEILEKEEKYKNSTMEERKKAFNEIHEMLGGKIKLFISGAAALDKKIEERYRLLGINLVQGYGLTETSPVISCESDKYQRPGSAGRPLFCEDVQIINTDENGIGEITVKGPNVMLGYYENEEKTKEVLVDGYFHTGDLGYIDKDGYLFVTGRIKDMIVLKNGKKIFPQELEILLNNSSLIEESFVYLSPTQNDKLCTKLVYSVDNDNLKGKSEEEIYELLKEEVKKVNLQIPSYKNIYGIKVTNEPLIKTTTQKIKRHEEIKRILG